MEFLIPVLLLAFAVWIVFVVPASMAKRRNRSAVLWILVSLVGSPLLAILLLFIFGPKTDEQERGVAP